MPAAWQRSRALQGGLRGEEVGKGTERAGVSERNGRRIETDRANTGPD